MADQGQRTEAPTQRRLEKARREGKFPQSKDFVAALVFLAFAGLMSSQSGAALAGLQQAIRFGIREAFHGDLDAPRAVEFGRVLLTSTAAWVLPAGALLVVMAVAAQLVVTRMGVSLKKLAPEWERLSPASRLREMPGQNLSSAVKAILLLPLFAAAVWAVIRPNLDRMFLLPLESAAQGSAVAGDAMRQLLWRAAALFLALGAADLFRQRRKYTRDLRMSKQEIRDEIKELEGNPQLKGRIRQLQRERVRRRMMQQVPRATAIIVNPTHYAVALRYAPGETVAPMVLAKGRNFLARRIREKAVAHQIPIIENPPLAQALYHSVEVGQEIPAHLYRAVAEVLAYIYRLMHGRMPG